MNKPSVRRWDWLSASLLFILIQVAAARLVVTNWAPFLFLSELTAACGTILGLALGFSRYKRRIVIWFVIDYTLAVLPWQMTSAAPADLSFSDKLLGIGRILIASLGQFFARQPVKDSLFFVAVVSLIFWGISLCAGYWLIRHQNILVAVLPSGIGILFIQIYDNFNAYTSWWLAAFLVIALLLLGRYYYLLHEEDWKKRRVFISEEAWTDIFGVLFAVAASAVIIAWIIPTSLSSLRSASETWNKVTRPVRDRLSNAVSSLNAPYAPPVSAFYGDTLALGRAIAQGDTVVFSVKVLSPPDFSIRYYWRGRAYDFYNNGQWSDSPAARVDFVPGNNTLNIPNAEGREEGDFEVAFQLPAQNQLYAPSQPVWMDKRGSILVIPTDSASYDLLSWDANPPVTTGMRYEVRAEIANPTIDELRASSTAYPQWVTQRYLQVPKNILPQIQSLAEHITAGQNNPYDEAEAITDYLRNNLSYSASLASPPSGEDPVLWVLFDYKKAFCTYYASAEVLMLRSIGIPARLAVGYAQGKLQNDTYIVRQLDTHAWPEVYFSGIGWVEFEPTVIQAPLVRPENPLLAEPPISRGGNRAASQNNGTLLSTGPAISVQGRAFAVRRPAPYLILFAVLSLSVLMQLVFLFRFYRPFENAPLRLSNALERRGMNVPGWIENWRRWNQLGPVEKLFASVNLSLGWLGQPQSIDVTAAQRAALLEKMIPSAAGYIEALKAELESALFTPRPANVSRARRASLFILLHTFRALLLRFWDMIAGSDVYSG